MPRNCLKKERETPSLALVTDSVEASASCKPTTITMSVKEEDRSSMLTPSTPTAVSMDVDMKIELHTSPSQSPTLAESSNEKCQSSPTHHPISAMTNGTKSKTSTPPPNLQSNLHSVYSKKATAATVQLIGDLPVARDEALKTFVEIRENNYQYKTLGRCKELLESMTCDCSYEDGIDNLKNACGSGSDCINRLTQVECLPDDCRCRSYCQNQRFQRQECAEIEIIMTERKGFGLRAERDMPKDSFIYEYVGDVVNTPSFKKRMREYGEEGIQHFYFMMLQKDEFIDATKNGGIGRFANHSCGPNCYVAKWTIGDRVRMGIFAKRDIQKHEEITFNYNVDRYGHQAQPCYCGEPNCVGFIGGKTQTDIVTIDDLYLDALGITDEADIMELKGTKKKKGKKIDDPDFMPTLKPLVEKDVTKVMAAMRQTQSRKVLIKLLTRMRMTEDQAALRQVMRLRGFSMMNQKLEEYVDDKELILQALQCMSTWPLMNRNKVEDSRIIITIRNFAEHEETEDNAKIRSLAQQLVSHWESLPLYNRIPKRLVDGEENVFVPAVVSTTEEDERPCKKPRHIERDQFTEFKAKLAPSKPPAWQTESFHNGPMLSIDIQPVHSRREYIQAIIDQAAAAEAAAVEAAVAEKQKAEEASARKKSKPAKKHLTPEEKEANKERRLQKLVGVVVVKCMSKYAKSLDRELFKKYAKELTQVIAEKEKKSSTFKDGKLDALSEEKAAKIKKFAKDYIAKILRKLEKSKRDPHRPPPPSSTATTVSASAFGGDRLSSSSSSRAPNDTPQSAGECVVVDSSMMGVVEMMSVEEAMDMEFDSGSEAGGGGDDDDDDREEEEGEEEDKEKEVAATFAADHDQMEDISLTGLAEMSPPSDQPICPDVANEPTASVTSESTSFKVTTDPRRRPVSDLLRC